MIQSRGRSRTFTEATAEEEINRRNESYEANQINQDNDEDTTIITPKALREEVSYYSLLPSLLSLLSLYPSFSIYNQISNLLISHFFDSF